MGVRRTRVYTPGYRYAAPPGLNSHNPQPSLVTFSIFRASGLLPTTHSTSSDPRSSIRENQLPISGNRVLSLLAEYPDTSIAEKLNTTTQ